MTISRAEAAKRAAAPPSRQVLDAVNALVRSLNGLDAAGDARAAIARQLARKMDAAGTGATSLALLSRELRSVLADLIDPTRDATAASLIAEIFGS
jgi:hypothetical protein